MFSLSTAPSSGDLSRSPALARARAYGAILAAKLRVWGPYAMLGLMPGGSVVMLLFWIYRRRQEIGAILTRCGLF
jgi:hypothetical protein